MGGSRSSSKRKSSKRKSSKISSEARRKKRSRRIKSRKLRRPSNDDSRSSVPISSSSSEDEYSRARSRTRSEVKGSRKRTRRSSSSRESSEDSRHVKKKKGSKRSANSETRKKSQRKKRRREPSVSSMSSDSRSCSTCQGGGGSSSGESDFERPRRRSREKNKDKRASGKAKSGTKSNKNRSRSCSSCSRNSDGSGYGSKDILPVENSSRRLRSVITTAKSPEAEVVENEWDKDGHKEEIVYDRDDCPSCRSNDSNDGGSKRELAHHSHVDVERWVENVKGEEALVSHIRMTELTKSGEVGGAQDCQSNSRSDGPGAHNFITENKREDVPTLSSSNGNDLESILRLKALENLKKYRGGHQKNAKPPADEKSKSHSDVKQLSTANVEFVQNRSPKEDVSIVDATRVLDQNPRPTMGRDSSHPATSSGKVQEGKGSGSVTESGSARQSVVCPPNQVAISDNSKEGDLSPAGTVISKSEPGKPTLRKESSGTILKQTHDTNMLVTESHVIKSSLETSKSVGQTSNNNGVGVNNVCESSTSEPPSLKPTLEEHSSKEQQGGDKDGSQFEQKTMSVMRGGEMVQVSYKVYIPKKAPALARRHLRR